MSLHAVLQRQLKRLGLTPGLPPDADAWAKLLLRVSNAYTEGDNERYLLERSLTISSDEMRELYEARARSEARQAALREVATAVAGGGDPAAVADLALTQAGTLLGPGTTLRWVDESEAEDPPHTLSTAMRTAITGGAPVREPMGDAAMLVVPVMVTGRVRAVLTAPVPSSQEHTEQLVLNLADLVALAVVNTEATEQLTTRATTDPLTGLANARVFKERLDAEVRRTFRHGHAMSLLVVDVDEFKQVNDTHGHQVGDTVLVEVARRLASVARAHDLPARVGGEEFAVLLPETDGMGAFNMAERIRAVVAETPVPPAGRVTISVGVCALADASDAHDLMSRADTALFWSKANGRNITFRWTPETAAQLRAIDGSIDPERIRALTAVRSLARAVDARDPRTHRHSDRVADLSHALALELGWTAGRAAALRQVALVHDVGKVGLPQGASAAGPLPEEAHGDLLETHPELGARILAELLDDEQLEWVRAHHERPDGTGFPRGLHDADIPDGARVLAVADVWDEIARRRPGGGDGPAIAASLDEMRAMAGTRLCPDAVSALERLHSAGVLPELTSGGGARTRAEVPWA